MKKIICLIHRILRISLIGLIFMQTLAFAETDIIVEGGIIKRISTQEVSVDTLKQQFKSLLSRQQNAADALLKVQNDIQAFKDLLTKAGIDFKDW